MVHVILFHIAAAVPGGSPSAPPGLSGGLSNLIDWGKWIASGVGLAGVLYSGGKLTHAHQTGGYSGGHHAGLWMALAGCAVIGAAPTLVGALT
jgi:hypothetical protein